MKRTRRRLAWTVGVVVALNVAALLVTTSAPTRDRVGVALGGVRRSRGIVATTAPAPSTMWSTTSTTIDRQTAIVVPLQDGLTAAVAPYAASCFEVVRGSQLLASFNASAPLIPASTEKLLTAATAWALLGGDYRYVTRAVVDGPVTASVARVWLVGAGDPLLRTADQAVPWVSTPLEGLADSLAALGIRHVGQVVGDDSRYDQVRFLPTWSPNYQANFEVGPISALSVDDGIPLLNGQPLTVEDPAQYTAARFTTLLRARGVNVDSDAGHAPAPADASAVAAVDSAPLRVLLAWILRTSDNTAAETITKELGIIGYGQGTTAAGVATIRDILSQHGVPVDGVQLQDGSGLDRSDRVTCHALVAVLALSDQLEFSALRSLLPAAGRTTLLAGRVWAKSGYLSDVTGLAGVIDGYPPLRFAFLLNGNVPPSFPVVLDHILNTIATNLGS